VPLPPNPYPPSVVVLDDETAAQYLGRHLEGYDVRHAADAAAARELAERWHPAAIVTTTGGDEAAMMPPEGAPDGPVLVRCTLPVYRGGDGQGRYRAWLTKPVSGDQFLAALHAVAAAGDVLIVDDDRGFVQLLLRMLQESGEAYSVRWAYSGEEALRKMAAQRPDVVVLDMVMPGMSGLSLADAIHADPALADVPLLAVTGAAGELLPQATSGFHVWKAGGLKERELLGLLRNCLATVQPDYARASAPLRTGAASPSPATAGEGLG
jgi:CheY-like chemotaxis protein